MKDLLLSVHGTLSLKPYIWKFYVVVCQTTSKNSTKVRAARAARLFVFTDLSNEMFYSVIVAASSSLLKLPNINSQLDRFQNRSLSEYYIQIVF